MRRTLSTAVALLALVLGAPTGTGPTPELGKEIRLAECRAKERRPRERGRLEPIEEAELRPGWVRWEPRGPGEDPRERRLHPLFWDAERARAHC